MLRNSFCHIPGIGPRLEQRLWMSGVRSWQAVIENSGRSVPRVRFDRLLHYVRESSTELDTGNAAFFARRLPAAELWRLFTEFRHSAAYLDIETTGHHGDLDFITTIALYDGRRIRYYVQDQNLDDFPSDILHYKLIVTYNGKCFDVPLIERHFGLRLEAAHVDLRYVLASLGFKGGLKTCEKHIGIHRGDLDGLDGYWAVLLWHDYVYNGNERALETLLAYNIADVVNLEALMVEAYNAKLRRTPFCESHRCEVPVPPPSPLRPDRDTIGRIRRYLSTR